MKVYPFKKTVFNCKQATLLSLKKEEGKITFRESVLLWYHLLYCKFCKRFTKQSAIINKLGETVAETLFTNPPHTLSGKSKAAIQRKLDNPGQ